jgi:hypothetical protein
MIIITFVRVDPPNTDGGLACSGGCLTDPPLGPHLLGIEILQLLRPGSYDQGRVKRLAGGPVKVHTATFVDGEAEDVFQRSHIPLDDPANLTLPQSAVQPQLLLASSQDSLAQLVRIHRGLSSTSSTDMSMNAAGASRAIGRTASASPT